MAHVKNLSQVRKYSSLSEIFTGTAVTIKIDILSHNEDSWKNKEPPR